MSLMKTSQMTGITSLRLPSQSLAPLLRVRHPVTHSRPQHVRTLFYVPMILQPAFWRSLTPSFLRRDTTSSSMPTVKKPSNPATYFIWLSLLIGSQAIQLITLRKGFAQFTLETDQKLALLREVVRRVRAGEDVDVEKELGTGDPAKEKQWEDVMKELESEDAVFAERKREERKRKQREEKGQARDEETRW